MEDVSKQYVPHHISNFKKKLLGFYLKEYYPQLCLILALATWLWVFFWPPTSKVSVLQPVHAANNIFTDASPPCPKSTHGDSPIFGIKTTLCEHPVDIYSLWPTSFPNLFLNTLSHNLSFFSALILKGKLSCIIMGSVINFPDCKIFEMTGKTRKYGQWKLFGERGKDEMSTINNLKSQRKLF